MGFRFRKSFKLAKGVRMTFSKSGVSTRIGGKGFSVSSGKRGTRMNIGIPGTGLSYSTKLTGGSKKRKSPVHSSCVQQTSANKLVTFLLCLFLGFLGAHKFYLGRKAMGILYLCTVGLFGIGWVVDTIRLYVSLFIDPTQEYTEEEKEKKVKTMLIIAAVFIAFVLLFVIANKPNQTAVENNDKIVTQTETIRQITEVTTTEYAFNYDFSKPDAKYFTYNATIDDFIIDYNKIAEFPVVAGEVKRGNINSKAIFNLNNCYIVAISSKNLEIRIDAYNNNDLYNAMPVVTDMIKVVDPDIKTEQIEELFKNGTAIEFANGKASKIGSNFDLSLDYKGLTE